MNMFHIFQVELVSMSPDIFWWSTATALRFRESASRATWDRRSRGYASNQYVGMGKNRNNVGIAIINHPPFFTISMGGINHPQ